MAENRRGDSFASPKPMLGPSSSSSKPWTESMGRKLERGTSDSVGKDSTRAPGRQSTRGGSIERGTSDGRSFGSKSSIRERVLRMKSFNASNRQFSKLRDSRWNTVKRKFRRFAKIVTRARDKLFEWDKSGQKKHVKAAEETLDTYHESYLYGHVPFTIRLRAALRVGRVGNTLAVVEFVLALLSVGLYIRSTYTTYQPIVLPVLEAVASVYFVLDYILKLYSAPVRLLYIFSINGIIDLLSALPVMYLFQTKSSGSADNFIQIFRFLRIIRIFYIIRRLRIIGGSVAQQVSELIMYTLGIVFIMAGIFQYVERRSKDCKPGVTNSEGCVNFYQAFYFIVTTVLTVQLGDITPHSELGREVVLATIIISLTVIPLQISKISDLAARRPYGGAFSAGKVLGARFVILSGSIRFETVRNYLAELYSPVPKDELAAFPLRVIIMAPFKPSFALKTMLTQYSGLVHFIEGSPLKESDLDRVSAKEATAVYLLANKFSQDYSLEDYGQMARALSVHQYCGPSVRVLVELVNPENRGNPIWDGTGEKNVGARSIETICLQELRFKLLARSCYVKGLSTLLSNLFASAIDFHPPKTGTAEEEYYHGLTQSIYPVLLPAAFVGKPFEKIAELIYTEFSALLVGLDVTASREAPEEGDAEPLRMFPMGELIGANDVGLIIAESLALVKHVSTFGSQTFTDRISSCCIGSVSAEELYVHLCAKMDYEDTWQGGNLSSQGALALGEGSMRGRVFKLDPKKSDPSGWEIKNDMQQMRGSSSNLSVRGYWNEEEPDWYLEIDRKNYSLEEVTEKLLTWPPVLVGGRPSPEVIAGHREIIEEDLTQKTLSLVRLSERHILVCCEGQWPHNLYYFVEHLRLEGFPTPPIVILSPEEPGPEQWGCLGIFEDVYYVKGSGTCELDLMRAGHGECECVVVVAEDIQGTSRPGDDTDQQQASSQLYANDLTNTIIASKAEKGLGGKKGVVVELQYNPTFQYLKPLYQIHPVTVRKMSSRRNRDGLHLFLPSYAMGKGFGANMLDYLLAPSFTNKNTVHIFLAFVHEALSSIERPDEEMGYNQNSDSDKSSDDRRPTTMPAWDLVHRQQQHENEASGSGEDNAVCNEIICVLDIIHVPPGCGGLSYLHLFRHLLHSRGLLSLGLYRAAKDPDGTSTKFGDPSGYVFTNPPHNATVCPLDLVYVFRRRPRNRNTSSST